MSIAKIRVSRAVTIPVVRLTLGHPNGGRVNGESHREVIGNKGGPVTELSGLL